MYLLILFEHSFKYQSFLCSGVVEVVKYAYYGGFQLEFVSISRFINHMTSYNSSALIGWNYSIQTGEQIL